MFGAVRMYKDIVQVKRQTTSKADTVCGKLELDLSIFRKIFFGNPVTVVFGKFWPYRVDFQLG